MTQKHEDMNISFPLTSLEKDHLSRLVVRLVSKPLNKSGIKNLGRKKRVRERLITEASCHLGAATTAVTTHLANCKPINFFAAQPI